MKNISIELPKYRLFLKYRLVKRRKPLVDEPLIPTPELVGRKFRKGTFLSRFFRHIFEHKNIKKAVAANFAVITVATSLMPQSAAVQAQEFSENPTVEGQVVLVTEKGSQYPTAELRITQRFSFFHPGIDLDGVTGDEIKPIKPGKVVHVDHSKFAYGNSVIVDHGNKIASLYAHLSKIEVKEGQNVDMNTKLGEMGATGRSFGDHLHIEVYDHGKPINPLSVLPR